MPSFSSTFSTRIKDLKVEQKLLDYLTRRFPYHTEKGWNDLLALGRLKINESPASPHTLVGPGDELVFSVVDYHEPDVPTDYKVLFDNRKVIMVHKPAGMPVNRTGKVFFNTLVNRVREGLGDESVAPLNRLDRESCGIVVFARGRENLKKYSLQNPRVTCCKLYAVVTVGMLEKYRGTIDRNLGTIDGSPIRCQMYPVTTGKKALTCFERIETKGKRHLLAVSPVTGRKHQIRAHLAMCGIPVLGDKIYSKDGRYYLKRLESGLGQRDLGDLGASHHLLHCFFVELCREGEQPIQVYDWDAGDEFSRYFSMERVRQWVESEFGRRFFKSAKKLVLPAKSALTRIE